MSTPAARLARSHCGIVRSGVCIGALPGRGQSDRITTALLADTHQLDLAPSEVEVSSLIRDLENQGDSAEVCGSILEM